MRIVDAVTRAIEFQTVIAAPDARTVNLAATQRRETMRTLVGQPMERAVAGAPYQHRLAKIGSRERFAGNQFISPGRRIPLTLEETHALAPSSRMATARVHPADAARIFMGKQATVNPTGGSTSRLCSFSRWQ